MNKLFTLMIAFMSFYGFSDLRTNLDTDLDDLMN